jgi:hypothetical protein
MATVPVCAFEFPEGSCKQRLHKCRAVPARLGRRNGSSNRLLDELPGLDRGCRPDKV